MCEIICTAREARGGAAAAPHVLLPAACSCEPAGRGCRASGGSVLERRLDEVVVLGVVGSAWKSRSRAFEVRVDEARFFNA